MPSRLLCRLLVVVALGLVLAGCDEMQYNGTAAVAVIFQPAGGTDCDSVTSEFQAVTHQSVAGRTGDNIELEGRWCSADGSFFDQTVWYLNTSYTGIIKTVAHYGSNGAPLTGKFWYRWTWTDDAGDHVAYTDTAICMVR